MDINKLLNETPLPDDWDKSRFDKSKNSFRKILSYAKYKAQYLGAGSSRVAFIIPYEGRETVLKIAKNKKGIVQNEQEISLMFNDYYLKNLGVVIPGIDYDKNEPPVWIHTEKADKITEKQFENIVGISVFDAFRCARYMVGVQRKTYALNDESFNELMSKVKDEDFINALANFVGSYNEIVTIDDIDRIKNWGLYKGRPVIIDIGFGPSSFKLYGFQDKL